MSNKDLDKILESAIISVEEVKKLDPKELGVITGKLLSTSWRVRNLRVPEEEKEPLQKTLGSALNRLLQILPEMLEVVDEQPPKLFYQGIAQGIVEARTSFSDLVGFFPSLPGEPRFEETWRISRDEVTTGQAFFDRFRNRCFRAQNETGKLLIQCLIDQFRQRREMRESTNQTS